MTVERWPLMIAAGLLLVVLVNGGFLWVAVQHPPTIERSYQLDQDR